MSKQGSSRKPLIIGIIAAVVILGAVLALLLTQCTGGTTEATQSTPVQTTVEEIPTYDLYWNLDRAEYDGKSEAGMSSRQQESDGYFHIRFFYDGEIVELRAADRKIINAIDVNDLMGLEFDDNGIITGVTSLDDMPVEQVGWQFYVQSVGGKLLKLNSSKTFNGLEVLLDITDRTGIWDMTGKEGEVGMPITPISGDRVIALADLGGELTHVYVYDRPEYMQTFKAYCQHCEEEVEWKMWTKENELPGNTGHYQLQNNISGMSKQQYINEDQKVCLDLNGMQVDGKENARVYTMHYPGAHLAIMDNSEGQKGVLRGHSTASDQGGVVWVRYGQFHLYSGTLDGSDMVCKLNGAAMDITKGSYFYMHGGKIIGGTAKAVKNDKGNWTNGIGGTMVVRGKFVMNGGVIEGGKATGVITKRNADGTPNTYARGYAGNIYVGSGGVVEMNGGTIKGGSATYAGGNVYVDGTGEFTMNGGVIEGGRVTGKGRNGGNVFVTSKSTFTLKSGRITGGRTYNCGANLYLNGKVFMTGGYIGGGKAIKWGTNEVNTTENRTNVFNVNGKFYMYGGTVDGSFFAIDTNATDNNQTYIYLTTHATIFGNQEDEMGDLVLDAGGGGVVVDVGNLRDTAKIGINAMTGIFTRPTLEKNLQNFVSNVEGAEVCYVDGCLALGRWSCLCGNNDKGGHYGECDGTQLFWGPHSSTTLPSTTGNYYLIKDITAKAQSSIGENQEIRYDLNGHTLTAQKNFRGFSLHNPGAKLTITDSSEGKTGVLKTWGEGNTQGNAIWVRYGQFDFYGGTLDGSEYHLYPKWAAGTDGVFGTTDDKEEGRDGGTVAMGTGTTFNMYGGTIIGNNMARKTQIQTVKETTVVDGEEKVTTKEVSRMLAAANGASVSIASKCVFNMYDGVIRDGYTENTGGNLLITSSAVANLYKGTISGGQAGPLYKEDGKTVVTKGWGGNIELAGTATLNILGEDVLITGGVAGGNGGNIRVSAGGATLNMQAGTIKDGESKVDQAGNIFNSGVLNLTGGVISGGKAVNGGNISINSGKDSNISGVTIKDGTATKAGGNVIINTTSLTGVNTFGEGTVISGGHAGTTGGNLHMAPNNANKNNPNARAVIDGAVIKDGTSVGYGSSIYVATSGTGVSELTINSGSITGGKTVGAGGGVYATGATASVTINGGIIADNVARWGGNIYLDKATLTINGGTISNGSTYDNGSGASGNGGNIYSSNGPITLNAGTITGGKTGDFGGNVWTNTTFTMNGGTVSNGEAIANTGKGGGNLFTNNVNGKFYLNGGTVEGGKAGKGGSIFINNASAILVIDGATVTGGQTTGGHGGNINSIGTVTVKSGVVKDGISKDTAGNIYANAGKVVIEGGQILGGVDKNGANADESSIYVVSAGLEVRGGEMDGGVYVYNYKNDNGSIKMSGNPVIKSDTRNGLRIHYSDGATHIPYIQIDAPMTEGAEVYVTNTNWQIGKFTTATEEAYAKYFHADDDTRSIGFIDGCVALGKTYCVCGSTTETHEPGCNGEKLFWMPWASGTSLPTTSGNWYIHPSVTVTLSAQQKITVADQKVRLDLNGRTVKNAEGAGIRGYWLAATGDEVTITDTVGGGKIVNNGSYDQGGIFWIAAGQTKVTLIKGTLDASGFTSRGTNAAGGVAVCVASAGATFNMYNGKLLGGTCPNGGGAIFGSNWDSRVYIYGGEVIGNENEENPSVRLMGTKNEIENATVTGGVEINSYRFDAETTKPINQLTLKSGAKIDSILIADVADARANGSGNYTILPLLTVDGTLTDAITISTFNEAPHVFTAAAVDAANEDNFISGSSKLIAIRNTDGKLELIANDDPTYHCICGTPAKHQEGCDGTSVKWTEWTSTNSLPLTSGYWYLSNNVELSAQQKIVTADQNIYLDLNGKTVSNAEGKGVRMYWISVKANVTITDCSAEQTGVMYNDGVYDQGMGFWIAAGNAKLTLYNATIDLSDATYKVKADGSPNNGFGGTAVYVASAGASANLVSGKVLGGKSPNGGGAVTVNAGAGIVNVYDAVIIGNENDGGCGVYNTGIMNVYGGTIEGGIENSDKNNGTLSGLWISGEPAIDFIKLTDAPKDANDTSALKILPITLNSALELEKPIKLYSQLDGIVAVPGENVTLDETALDQFFGVTHALVLKDGKIEAISGENVYCLCGSSTEEHALGCDGVKLIWTELTSLAQLRTPGNYYLTKSYTTTDQFGFAAGETRLDFNGYTITDSSNRLFTTNGAKDAKVFFTDASADKKGGAAVAYADGVIYAGQGNGIWLAGSGCEVNWIAGTLDCSKATTRKYGGSALCIDAGTTFNLYGGTIKGGITTLDNHQHSGGEYPYGGAIRISGVMNMYGGTVSGGQAVGTHGGNVALLSSGVLNLEGGTITGGQAKQHVSPSKVDDKGNPVKTNGHGGNVALLSENAVLNISGGEIINGVGVQWAGNIYLYPGTMNMTGGLVKGGKIGTNANNLNANIGMRTGSVINMSGGDIYGRVTVANGSGTLNFSGSAKITSDGTGVKGNIVSTGVTINIGKVNADARIGFQCSGVGGVDSADSLNGNKFLANVADDSYKTSMSDISVYIDKDNYTRTYELFVENGKLYAKQTSRTAK